MVQQYPKIQNTLDILVADSTKPDTLEKIIPMTRVIACTAGPFDLYATPVVQLCSLYGTHYVDITGETDWVRKMVDTYDDDAKASGAKIVHFCGHDCVPWDMAVYLLAEELRKRNENLIQVECFDEINGAYSGGTMATLAHSLQNRKRVKARLPYDPLLKMKHGESVEQPSESRTEAKLQASFGYNASAYKGNGAWVGPFIMAMVMANCIRRSNAINKYSGANTLRYYEALSYSNVYHMIRTCIYSVIFGTCLYTPILDQILYKYFLPAPGEGPSEKDMKDGYLRITAVGTGDQGTKVQTTLVLGYDPGYVGTAAMLMECADLLESEETSSQLLSGDEGGVYTPASCFGQPLMKSLRSIGFEYQTEILLEQ
uniref:Putative trans-acting enoyl reductase MT2525 n=1 Tax=Lygus hesperus TaxID=30085 RepID=A0A0A9Y308_LYGHE